MIKLSNIELKATFLFFVFIICMDKIDAQDLKIFGYSQSLYQNQYNEELDASIKSNYNYFFAQQTNVFILNNMKNRSRAFINIEFINNQDVANGFGNLSLQEAWVDYSFFNTINLKAGKLLPKFGYLNEQRNRTPLFNFALRPAIYENLFGDIFDQENYLPLSAFFQIESKFNLSRYLMFEASAFLGNSEDNFLISRSDLSAVGEANVSGQDTTSTVTIGGKLNLIYSNYNVGVIKLGYSTSYDNAFLPPAPSLDPLIIETVAFLESQSQFAPGSVNLITSSLGSAPRRRHILDLFIQLKNLEIIGEYAWSDISLSRQQERKMNEINQTITSIPEEIVGYQLPNFYRNDLSSFWYVNANYIFDNELYLLLRYEQLDSGRDVLFNEKLKTWVTGFGYRYDNKVIKFEVSTDNLANGGIAPPFVKDLFHIRTSRVSVGFTF